MLSKFMNLIAIMLIEYDALTPWLVPASPELSSTQVENTNFGSFWLRPFIFGGSWPGEQECCKRVCGHFQSVRLADHVSLSCRHLQRVWRAAEPAKPPGAQRRGRRDRRPDGRCRPCHLSHRPVHLTPPLCHQVRPLPCPLKHSSCIITRNCIPDLQSFLTTVNEAGQAIRK